MNEANYASLEASKRLVDAGIVHGDGAWMEPASKFGEASRDYWATNSK